MANKDLKDFLKSNKPVEEKKTEEKKEPTGRTITLADGSVVELDELKPCERQSAILAQTVKVKKKYPITVPFEKPQYLIPPKGWKPLSEKQKEYKKKLLTQEDLARTSPKVYKNKNRQGLSRYIFIAELIACKNGFLYYTVPFLFSLALLIIDIFVFNFWANFAVAVFALGVILSFIFLHKSKSNLFLKIIISILLIAISITLIYLGSLIKGFYDLVFLPYALKLLLITFSLYHFGKFYVVFLLAYNGDCNQDFGNVAQVNAGKPRAGKTCSGIHDAMVKAKLKWKELCYDYALYTSMEDEILKHGTAEQKMLLQEVKLSYEFYTKYPCIPCLWSNIGIFDKQGRASHKVTIDHVKGLKRLPLYSVVFFDEIGAALRADDGLNRSGVEKPLDVSDMFRLGGHFLKWVFIGTEQDFNHIFIDCRRVVGVNNVVLGQEWVARPTLIYGLYKFMRWFIEDSLDKKIKKRPKLMKFMWKFGCFCNSIGFRRIRSTFASNTETKADLVAGTADSKLMTFGKTKIRYIPSSTLGVYSDRSYMALYASAFDRVIEGELHKSTYIYGLSKESLQFVNTTQALEEKRSVLHCVEDLFRDIA